jgi:undecaprenyl-diphosphatase
MRPVVLLGAAVALAGIRTGQRHLPKWVRGILAGVAVGLIAVGVGLVSVPDPEATIRHLGSTLGPYTYALVGVMAFLETGAGVGLVVPGELAVIVGGVAAAQGEVELVPLIALVWVCAIAGDLVSYMLGRRLGRDFLIAHGHRAGLTASRFERIERYFDRHGVKTIVIGRFIGMIRSMAPFAAGASGMSPRRFIPATVVAAGIWAATCTLVGYVFWQSVDNVGAIAQAGTFAIAAVAVLVLGGIAAARRISDGRARTAQRSP